MENKTNANDEEVHLVDYLVILAKNSRIIIYVTTAVTVLTYLFYFISPNKYTATVRILSPQQNITLSAQLLNNLGGGIIPGADRGTGGLGSMAAGLLGIKTSALYVSMLKSNYVLDHIIDQFNLKKVYKKKYYEDARKKLMKNASISAGSRDGIITIEVTDKNAKMAAEMANAFLKKLDKLLQGLVQQEAKARLAFLMKERVQAMKNLTKAEDALRLFSEKNSVLQIDAQTRGVIEYIGRLRGEIDAKEVQIQVLSKQATPFNYDMVRLETEVKGLKERLRAAETQYDNCVGDVCLPTSKTPAIFLEYLRLLREAKFQENLYRLYGGLVETARMDIARGFSVIQVIDRGKPPQKRSNKRLLPALLAWILTFMFMIVVVYGRELWRKKLDSEGQSQRWSELSYHFDNSIQSFRHLSSWIKKN